jgi:hypothetical protein
MKLRLSRGKWRVPRVPLMVEGTSKININKSIVPSVPLVPSIISRACEGAKNISVNILPLSGSPTLCKNEGTEGTRALQISVFRYPLPGKGTHRYPLPFNLEASL